jgi:elongation factor 1 alpha-like protein
MSRHKLVKNLDLDDELEDYDGGEDYGYDGGEGTSTHSANHQRVLTCLF